MKNNDRKLGDYIQPVDVRNSDLKVSHLLGLSVEKRFIESIANTIGTDFSKYKIVKKGQFTYIPDTSRRGDKIGIALLTDYDEGLVSNIYTVFEITDTSKLLPEYLMLWFSRSEFDRYARYKSHGSVREIFDWDEMCRVELPVPPLNEQQKIVNTYNAITKRIQLKQKINENILKQGIQIVQNFVGNAIYSNKTDSEIEEIKSSLPINQKMITIKEFCMNTKSGSTPSRTEIDYWKNGNIPWLKSGEVHNNVTVETEEYITKKATEETSAKLLPENTVLMAMYGVTAGEVGYLGIETTTNQAICGMICNSLEDAAYLYFSLLQNQKEISSLANGGAQNNLSKELIENLKLVIPENISELKLNVLVRNLILNTKELQKLNQLKQLIVSQISKR
ncbi:restriction endonuclease subunit S [Treponema porcinum]|uniref:restriction endonuclease subunit S n=1 Tax=Treponema porcinum TaxID=261392 RepID=UPI0023575EBA|nr:restriction endonuclease subunit S [Treponema porcinum]MCI6481914.1 restriction endonuclease subunit S [Treponema porcinum]